MPNTGRQANNGKSKISLETQTSLYIGTNPLKNVFGDGCGSGRNVNKEVLSLLEDYIVYNFFG